MEETNQTLERWIELLKKFSLFGGLFTGTGLALLYFFGIAIYSTYNAMLGIPPYDFSLQKCLEVGGSSVVRLLTVLPALVVIGINDNLKEATLSSYIFFSLPLIMLLAVRRLKKYSGKWGLRSQRVIHWSLLIYVGVFLTAMYATLLSSYATQNLLLNPDVNTLIEHRETLLQEMEPSKIGLPHLDYWTANIVVQNESWINGKIGAMYSMAGLFLLYAVVSLRASGRFIVRLGQSGMPCSKWFIYLRRGFSIAFIVFLVCNFFVVPARTVTLYALSRPMVDADIQGLEALTAKYHFVLVGDYDQRYAFYLPNRQDVIVVPKSKVNSVTLLEPVSVFADRRLFLKTKTFGLRTPTE